MSEKSNNEINDKDISEVAGGINDRVQPSADRQMICPACKGNVPLSLYQLISIADVFCPCCGLRISMLKRN